MSEILLTDLIPIHHGEAILSVDSKRVTSKGVTGYRGVVKIRFPKAPKGSYAVPVAGKDLRLTDTDATLDAIALRKDLIAQNVIAPKVDYDSMESNANYRRIERAENGHRE